MPWNSGRQFVSFFENILFRPLNVNSLGGTRLEDSRALLTVYPCLYATLLKDAIRVTDITTVCCSFLLLGLPCCLDASDIAVIRREGKGKS